MAGKNKLSIYLIKDKFSKNDQGILKKGVELLADLQGVGKVYYSPSKKTVPSWVNSFFGGTLRSATIFTSNARVVLISRIAVSEDEIKTFAVTMGYGKNLLAQDVIEEDFGLKVVLNTIEPSSLRRINKLNIGGNHKSSNEQLPLKSEIDDFGFDVDRDLIGTITGCSEDEDLATGMITGSDLLSLTAEVDVSNLCGFLKVAYSRYTSDSYKKSFGWVDHIRKVKSKAVISNLDCEIIKLISQGSPKVWMAVPEVIEWEKVSKFKYGTKDFPGDIDLAIVCESFRNPLTHVDQFKNLQIIATRADNEDIYDKWNAYKCLYAEVDYNGATYCLNNGRWFCIDKDYVSMINEEYKQMPISDMVFFQHPREKLKENEYTKKFVKSDPDHLLNMDAKPISHGGGRSKIELCDVLTDNHTYIHIKPYSGSATLSHLFNQAVVSAELVMSDQEFLVKANRKIKEVGGGDKFLISQEQRPTIILGIITNQSNERPPIPFFSKIALRYATRRLQGYGCNVYIKNIQRME